MFHGDLEVIGHTGGKSHRRRERLEHSIVFGLQPLKGLFLVPIAGRNTHQTDQLEALRIADLGADPVHRTGVGHVDTAAGDVAVKAHLDMHAQRIAAPTIAIAVVIARSSAVTSWGVSIE